MKCSRCGTVNQNGQSFCGQCGARLLQPQQRINPQQGYQQHHVNQQYHANQQQPVNQGRQPANNTNSPWLGPVIGIVGFLIAWEVSIVFGWIVSIFGAIFGVSSGSNLSGGVSIAICIICFLFLFL